MKRSLLYQVGGADGVDFESLAVEVALAEQLGIDTVWCFSAPDERGALRNAAPEIWLAGLASRTQRIRLGWGFPGMLPPERPPLRVAEQAASLDVASAGRLEVALIPEGDFGDPAEDGIDDAGGAAEAEAHAGWQEGYRMLVEMWDAPKFSWRSERFDVEPIDVVPKPVQRPHPPLWLAGWTLGHARSAGRGGLGFLDLSGAADDLLEIHRDAYLETRAASAPEDLVCVQAYGVAADLEPGEGARERLERWAALGFDQAVIRAGPLDGAKDEAAERIRFLSEADARVH